MVYINTFLPVNGPEGLLGWEFNSRETRKDALQLFREYRPLAVTWRPAFLSEAFSSSVADVGAGYCLKYFIQSDLRTDSVWQRKDSAWLWEHTSSYHLLSLEMLLHQMAGVIQGNAAHRMTSLPVFSGIWGRREDVLGILHLN